MAKFCIAVASLLVFGSIAHQAEQQGSASPTQKPQANPGQAFIWKDPGQIETRDTFYGAGWEGGRPVPPFTFVREKLSGTTAKLVVTDSKGAEWDVKFGPESHAEVAGSRLIWAVGYLTEEMYYVSDGVIQGAHDLQRAAKYIARDGRFHEARFRRRDPNIDDQPGGWAFDANPFVGKPELSGLILMMAIINNWDTADTTNKEILDVTLSDGSKERWYVVQDLGASFGRFVGPQGTPIKWFVKSYQEENLVQKSDGFTVYLNYAAYGDPPRSVPIEHARWLMARLLRVQEWQIRRAFEAAGATPEEQQAYTAKVVAKIGELRYATGGTL